MSQNLVSSDTGLNCSHGSLLLLQGQRAHGLFHWASQPASLALQGSCTWLLDTWGCRELALEGRSSEDSGSAWSRGGSLSQPSRRQPFWPATAHFLRQNTCLYIINVCFVKKNWTNLTFYMAEGTFSSLAPWICGQRISRRLAIKTFDGLSLLCFYIHNSIHWI